MTTVTFDTQELVTKLKAAGFAPEQAEAIVRAISDSHGEIVTKPYLSEKLSPIYTDLAVLKWMMGFNLALSFGILWKLMA